MIQNYLFIAGAPRSGTTFLMNQLGQHLDITPSKEGASYYFMDEHHPLVNKNNNYHKGGLYGFGKVFGDIKLKYLLDGTDHLMYQLSMIDVINKLPEKKMIFIFREPAQRIYSSFNFTKNNLGNFKKDIPFREYADALLNDDKKQIKKWLVSDKRSGFVLAHELEYSHYHNYIARWINKIGKENMIFLLFDQMLKGGPAFMNNILNQLSLEEFEFMDSENNESYQIKNKGLHRRIMGLSSLIPSTVIKSRIKAAYLKFQKKESIISEENEMMILELKKEFVLSNDILAEMINQDLTKWK